MVITHVETPISIFPNEKRSSPSSNPPVPQVEPQPVMQPSRNPSHGRPTRSQAPGKNSKIPNCQNPTTFMKADGFNKIWWTKSLVNPPLTIETPPLRNQNSCVFLMLLKWISYVTSTHLPVFESQKSNGPSPRVLYHFQKCILTTWHMDNQRGSLFVRSLKGATSRTPLQSFFVEGHQRLH